MRRSWGALLATVARLSGAQLLGLRAKGRGCRPRLTTCRGTSNTFSVAASHPASRLLACPASWPPAVVQEREHVPRPPRVSRARSTSVLTRLRRPADPAREHCESTARALREHCESTARGLREHCESTASTCRDRSKDGHGANPEQHKPSNVSVTCSRAAPGAARRRGAYPPPGGTGGFP